MKFSTLVLIHFLGGCNRSASDQQRVQQILDRASANIRSIKAEDREFFIEYYRRKGVEATDKEKEEFLTLTGEIYNMQRTDLSSQEKEVLLKKWKRYIILKT
jgi:hypothetical protein